MPVKSFKFVSPGVFINEIDNSFRPRRPDTIGPVVIGRSVRGLAMQPVKLESFSDFLTMYGDTVPGNAGGDVYRDGNYQSPMYGTYAAKAFLNASVAPVTYIRTLGSQNSNATAAGRAGWQTTENPDSQTFATLTISSTGVSAGGESLIITSEGTDFTIEFETAGTDSGSFDSNNLALINTTDNTTALEQSGRISTILGASTGFANYDVISGSSNILVRSKVGLNHASFTVVTGAASDASNVTGISVTGAGTLTDNGGAYGLWVFPSSSNDTADTGGSSTDDLGSAMLGAVWYMDEDSQIRLSGSLANSTVKAEGIGMVIESDASGLFTATVKGSKASSDTDEKFAFNFDDSDQRFVRKVFNTNPQLVNGGDFYDATLERNYWLGETFEQELREGQTGVSSITGSGTGNSILSQKMFGVILPIKKGTESPATMRLGTQEAQTGWVIGQDIGDAGSWVPEQAYKLFRLKGRGHGEWLHKNVKVSIENIRYSNTQTNEFGTFSLVLRSLTDTDANPVVLERFDNLTLDPRSTNYISRRIGDQYYSWVESERRLRLYGEYPNQSKFVYVSDINEGNIQNANSLVPFGYFGPPNFASVTSWSGSASDSAVTDSYIYTTGDFGAGVDGLLSGSTGNYTGSLLWPAVRLRHSASDGGLSDQTDAYFGMQTSRTVGGTRGDVSTKDYHRLWVASGWGGSSAGLVAQEYIFTMDDIVANVTGAYYASGSRADGTSKTATSDYKGLIDLGYNKFTMPLWGGFDGFDITKPDPLWNGGMAGGTELTNYAYNTYRRAIDTVADPEFIDMNLLAVPGLTNTGLTTHMVDVCEARADALALIDLPDVYLPTSEGQYTTKSDLASRQVADPTTAANALRDRQVDSSYGATFYPWVQTVDEGTGQALWVPPSVAMMGVLASSERSSQIWFAPAGFNRGGLSDGAAGIPVTSVSRRLTSKERDVLYEARINPIASFPSSGIVVFGQKTLQERPSALDRINVRRLVIYLKKQISILSTQILFEQNVQATWNRFKGLIEPFLANVKTQFGITDYRLILDESTTTPDLVDQNVVYAKIMIKPARAIEYIAIDFIVASTGASFDD